MGNFSEQIADEVRRLIQPDVLMANILTSGEIFLVIEDSDTDFNVMTQRFGNKNIFTTLEAAYAACVTNRNDIILMSANTTHALSTGIAWTKNRVHVIGMDGGDRLIQQGTKIQLSGAVDSAYVIKNTGVRNTFRNLKFIQSSTHANALTCFQFGGEGNVYKNCSFVFGVVDNLDQATAYEALMGEDSGTFIGCEFGTETLLTSAARSVMAIDQVTTNQEFKSNRFKDCNFVISSSETTATLLKVVAATDVLFTNNFKDCTFVASIDSAGGAALAVAVKSVASLVKGTLNFHNCAGYGATNFATDAVGNDNFYVYGAPNATGTDHVGILPVAT